MEEAIRLFSMTPREISLSIRVHQALENRRCQKEWLLSRYIALAVHAPDRLPPRPAGDLAPMTDDEMKKRLLSWRRKDQS